MNTITFYPVGNGDCSQIVLDNGKRILFDYRHVKESETGDSACINLKRRLTDELKEAKRDSFDVVAFTHGDKDHIHNSTEFFELWHADKYQGKDRIKIRELWVPAAMILDTCTAEQRDEEFVIWRQEARYRLKEGKGIRVFSRPDKLKAWLEENGLTLASRKHLITDAGQVVPDFTLERDGIEFFCHSPFVKHVDEGDDLRNDAALIFQVRFVIDGTMTNFFQVGDSTWEVLEDIVDITEYHKRDDRLDWDLFNIPHHCSAHALAEEKGETETVPTPKVKKLLLHGQPDAYIVSSSDPIPDTPEAYTQKPPPHIQAKKAYVRYLEKVGGRKFLVTMEEPNANKPEPIVFEIGSGGVNWKRSASVGAPAILVSTPPRAG